MQHARICHLHFEADCFKRDLQVRKYSLTFWSVRVFVRSCSKICICCCIFQEQLSIKPPLRDCFWVLFISFCKCHGKYFIYDVLFALCFMDCRTFHHEDYWKQTRFQPHFLILQKLPTNVMQVKNVSSFRERNRWIIGDFFCNWIILERRN